MRHRRHPLLVPFFSQQPPSPRRCPLDKRDVVGLVLGVDRQQVGFRNWYMGSIQAFHPPLRLVSDLNERIHASTLTNDRVHLSEHRGPQPRIPSSSPSHSLMRSSATFLALVVGALPIDKNC